MIFSNHFPSEFYIRKEIGDRLGLEASALIYKAYKWAHDNKSGQFSMPVVVNGFMTITADYIKKECFLDSAAIRRAVSAIRKDGLIDISINRNCDVVIGIPSDPEKEHSNNEASGVNESKKSKDRAGYIYLIRELSNGHVKIGRTIDPKTRHKTFSVKLPFKISVLFSFKCNNYVFSEEKLHEVFSRFHVDGEWFDLPEKHLEEIMDVEFLRSLGIDVVSVGGML